MGTSELEKSRIILAIHEKVAKEYASLWYGLVFFFCHVDGIMIPCDGFSSNSIKFSPFYTIVQFKNFDDAWRPVIESNILIYNRYI